MVSSAQDQLSARNSALSVNKVATGEYDFVWFQKYAQITLQQSCYSVNRPEVPNTSFRQILYKQGSGNIYGKNHKGKMLKKEGMKRDLKTNMRPCMHTCLCVHTYTHTVPKNFNWERSQQQFCKLVFSEYYHRDDEPYFSKTLCKVNYSDIVLIIT